MNLDQMVSELKEPLRSFVIDFVKDMHVHRNNDIGEDIVALFNMLKERYINNDTSARIIRKQEVNKLLEKLNLQFNFIDENTIKIYGESEIYGTFLETGHLYLEKQSRRFNKRVHKWPCQGLQAIESYLRQHALNLPRRP